MALLLTCYDETAREITSSLDSLVAQTGLDGHRRALIVVCDGRRKTGAGMRKTTAEVLRDEVFFDRSTREPETVRNAYVGWRRTMVDVDIFTGTYGGTLPFCCIIKHQNQSKRDSLLMVRSLLHKHNLRSRPSQPTSTETGIFSPDALHVLSTWLSKGAGIDVCDYVVGVDADTILHPSCIHHLVDEARQSGAAGVCGNLEVNFQGRVPTFWSLLTNAQFFAGQLINRRFQSLVTGRITCLTGCCQLLRVGGLNCGDQEVLAGPFGYYPGPSDNLWRQLIGKVGEDRHHTCIVHTTQPGARMTMAVQAVAYTNVPQSLGAFLNQRRRWTLSRLSNELLLVAGRDTHPFERVHAIVRLVHWVLFISIRMCGFLAFSPQFGMCPSSISTGEDAALLTWPTCMNPGFSPARRFRSLALLIIPRAFYLCMVVGRPIPALSRMYLAIGMVLSMLVGHFVFALSTLYTLYYMDYFGWRETLDGTGESISAKTPCFGEAAEPTNKDAKQS